jgi:translation initiation factor IF-3
VPEVRVIDDQGEQLGVMNTRDAVRLAREKGLDLVEVAATADPPVCRIIDFGKFQYEAKKKANEAKKKQVIITVKEVKFRPGTDEHDYTFKMKHARTFLSEGDKVKATIFFRGREITHRELGSQLLAKLEQDLAEVGDVEQRPRMEGNQMFLVFSPKKHKTAKQVAPPRQPQAPSGQPQPGVPAPQAPAQGSAQQPAQETQPTPAQGAPAATDEQTQPASQQSPAATATEPEGVSS